MAGPHVIERPRRWDLPFSKDLDLATVEGQADMTEEDLFLARLLSIEPFRSMRAEKFPKTIPLRGILKNDARLRRYGNGDLIVRQGDYGHSAFLILEGRVRAILHGLNPVVLGRRERKRKSWLRSLAQIVTNPKSPEARDTRQYLQMHRDAEKKVGPIFAQDVTNVLSVSPNAFEQTANTVMEKGEFFGELAALGRIPRSVTVVSDGDSELLEIRWQGLRDLRKYDSALRERIDEQYRTLGLSDTLKESPLLIGLNESQLQKITEVAEFETYGQFEWYGSYQQMRKRDDFDPIRQEPVISNEGDYPNGLILIRTGFARLSRKYGNGERTFSYLGKGDVYGLAELAHNARNSEPVSLYATLRAVGHVDVVRIPTRTFEEVILPNLPPEKIGLFLSDLGSALHPGASPSRPASAVADTEIDASTMEFLVENRFLNGTATMLIDLDRCVRCDECVRACATGHDNNPRFVRHGKIIGHHMVANACMHCVDPVCMIGCPTGAIHRDEAGGEIVINDLTCIGCGTCAASCPYDNIRMVDVRDRRADDAILIEPEKGRPISKATKCDLCFDQVGGPACERACPYDALVRADMRDLNFLAKWLDR